MKVGEACNRDVVIIGRNYSLLDAAKLMREYHVGDVVVVEDRAGERIPVGILTDRDIVIEILAEDLPLDAVTVGDAMSSELFTVREDEGIMETIKRMRAKGVRRIPVVNHQDGLVGILSVDDLIELFSEQMDDMVELFKSEQKHERVKCV